MEYQVQGEPGTVPAYPHHAPYGVQYTQHQGSMISENSHMTPNQGHPPLNSQHNSTNAPVNPCSQHRSLNSIQNQPQVAQKAYAVAVPQSSPLPHASNGYSANPGRPQPPLATPSQSSLNARNGHASQAAQQQARAEPPIDYQLLLMSIAEEYFAAAYGYGSMAAIVQREANMQEYYKLLATGLGCLEALLNHFKMLPETEAIVRLRYATILYEETENTMEAEEALSKGVSLCDRHRFFDLKYNMQHLLSRMLFKQNPRASLKFLDGVIKDVEAYQHIAWVYAFRFLKVSLHLELSTHQDTLSALGQLRQIINMSNEYGDKSILGVGTILEALTCLRRSSDVDSIEEAQRALASVRSLQLDPKIGKLHQLAVLASIVDLCCHLEHCDPGQAIAKMQIMQTALRDIHESKSWYADGSFAIPISNARMPHCKSSSGVVRKEQDGSLALMFDWMSKDDIYNLGYLLSGIALTHRNTQDGQKSEHMLEEGIKRMQYSNGDKVKQTPPSSISRAISQHMWREQTTCYMRLHLAFMLCARTSWSAAKEQQNLIQMSIQSMITSTKAIPEPLQLLSAYLGGVIYQGTGNLDQALDIYQSDTCSLQNYRRTAHHSQIHLNIVLLSALNTILIIRTPTHPKHDQLPSLLSFLESLCTRNPIRQIQSAYHLLTATNPSSSTILLTKQALQSALQTAKQSENNQLMCMVLNLMSWKFFRGVVGEQSEKSAQASQRLAQKCMDALWMSVAAGVLGDTLEAAGRFEEAKKARESGEVTARGLPEALQAAMRSENGDVDVAMVDQP